MKLILKGDYFKARKELNGNQTNFNKLIQEMMIMKLIQKNNSKKIVVFGIRD